MDDCTEASITRKLESSDYTNLHSIFSQYLKPLTLHLLNSQSFSTSSSTSRSSTSKSKPTPPSSSTIRSLLKSYIPFLNRSLSLLPKRLSDSPKPSDSAAAELFATYKLCLECVGCFTSFLSCKPYSVHLQTAKFVRCLVEWGRYSEAIDEGFMVLKTVGEMKLDGIVYSRESYVPILVDASGADGDLAYLVVEVVFRVFQSVVMSKTKEVGQYQNLLVSLNGIQPWLRVLDASIRRKFNRMLVSYLNKATRFSAKEFKEIGADLFPKFCTATFDEYQKLLGEQAPEIGVLKLSTEFLELLSYCAYECRASCIGTHGAVAAAMFNMDLEPYATISRLYASSLHLSGSRLQISDTWNADCISLAANSQLQDLNSLLSSVEKRFAVSLMESSKSTKDQSEETRKVYLKFYSDALKFLCRPLADFVNAERKSIINRVLDSSAESYLQIVQKSFCQLCDIFFRCRSCSFDTHRDVSETIDKTVLKVSIASFSLSLKLNLNRKKNCEFLQFLLSDKYLQYQGIKYLLVSLYDIALDYYRNKQLKESVEAMKLCFEASWTCSLNLCQVFAGKKQSDTFFSEDDVLDIANKASMSTSLFLDLLFEEGSQGLETSITYGLRKWSTMRDLFEKLPNPQSLVKQWVKIQCKSYKKEGNTEVAPTLYSYLVESVQGDGFSSFYVSKGTISIILEQELLAYQEMSNLCPEFCREMQMQIIEILLHDVHVTRDDWFKKSKNLISKGRLFRESGTDGLKNSICCLSEAIDTIIGATGEVHTSRILVSYQLAVAYSLRALSMHESEPSSKVQQMKVLCDIQEAVKIWLSIDITSESPSHLGDKDCIYILQLLYHIYDLLSLKGNMDPNICNLLIKAFIGNGKSMEKCLLMLWESRRLSHALCVSPINEAFFTQLSEDYGDAFMSVQYWLSCMKDAHSALLGFKQNFSVLCTQFPQAFGWFEDSLKSNVTVNDIKEAALHLISSDRNDFAFIVGCLYYDLAERLLCTGQLVEALHWAKEAHQLRCKLLQEHFSYLLEYQEDKHTEHGEVVRNQPACAKYIRVCTHIAIKVWDTAASFDLEGCNLTPWKVLQCYLESNLQVGIIQEVIGNGIEAEALFCWGKSISCLQGLSHFTVAFSACLGKVYHKMRLWELAEKELQSAKEVFCDRRESNSCLRCHLMMESTVDELLGNLHRSRNNNSKESPSIGHMSVEEHYKSAIGILNSSEWKGANKYKVLSQTSIATEAASGTRSNVHSFSADLSGSVISCSKAEQRLEKPDNRRFGRKKKEPSHHQNGNCLVTERPSRMTRSRNRSSQDKGCNGEREILDMQNTKCMKCFSVEDRQVDSLKEFIHMKWELGRRKQLLKVLSGLGKWKQNHTEVHGAHEVYSQCISVLHCRNPFCDCSHSETCIDKLEIVSIEVPEDILAVERATVLYNVCWFSLKSIVPDERRTNCCYLSQMEVSDIVPLLMHSFVLAREIPLLFQKVSRLLATLSVISACRSDYSLSRPYSPEISENYWAAYFHQASISARHNHWVLSHLAVKQRHINETLNAKGSQVCETNGMLEDMRSLFRLAPDSTQKVAVFIKDFFESLPTTTIICLTILGGSYASILKALVPQSSLSSSWMLLSHFNAKSEPVVILLPVDVIEKDTELTTCSSDKSSVVDVVAPTFSSILRDNKSSSVKYSEDTEKNRSMWWARRKGLDRLLSKLLIEMEESWLGPWKYLVLGQLSENLALETTARKLAGDLKRKCDLEVKESLLKVVLGAVKFASQEELSIPQIVLEKGCYVGIPGGSGEARCDVTYGFNRNAMKPISRVGFELMFAAITKLEEEHGTNRESVILVLDSEVQMLPWENMPILREQEVYRMPSMSCIFAVLRNTRPQQGPGAIDNSLPLIDPLDAFYLVNPSGDLGATQAEFEEWFRGQNLEGKAGTAPTSEELSAALKSHDVFLYFGHGSGAQYIPMHEIQKLDKCAACFLMGCSSGSVQHNGSYAPRGIVYSYISAGSPVVIANLWEVTDKDIDRFGRAVLEAWFAERSNSLDSCVQCSMLAEEMNELSLNKKTRNTKKGRGKKKSDDVCENSSTNWCRHKVKVGYFVTKARNACKLPYLIGAAPVCYGVPTGIRKKNDT